MNIVTETMVNRVDLVHEGSCSEAHIVLFKNKGGCNMPEIVQQILANMKPEYKTEMEKHIGDLTKSIETMTTDLAKAKGDLKQAEEDKVKAEGEAAAAKEEAANAKKAKPCETDMNKSFEELTKGADPSLVALFKSIKESNEELLAKAKKAEEDKFNAEVMAKSKELAGLPVEQTKVVELLKSKPADIVVEVLTDLAKSIVEGDMFKAKGSEIDPGNVSADSKIDSLATEMAKSKGISFEKAYAEVLANDPTLYGGE